MDEFLPSKVTKRLNGSEIRPDYMLSTRELLLLHREKHIECTQSEKKGWNHANGNQKEQSQIYVYLTKTVKIGKEDQYTMTKRQLINKLQKLQMHINPHWRTSIYKVKINRSEERCGLWNINSRRFRILVSTLDRSLRQKTRTLDIKCILEQKDLTNN